MISGLVFLIFFTKSPIFIFEGMVMTSITEGYLGRGSPRWITLFSLERVDTSRVDIYTSFLILKLFKT